MDTFSDWQHWLSRTFSSIITLIHKRLALTSWQTSPTERCLLALLQPDGGSLPGQLHLDSKVAYNVVSAALSPSPGGG